jgi:hypothetical protein
VRRVFAQDPSPAFEVIDAIGGGGGWPTLQALLKVESARDILYALLAPSDAQKAAVAGQDAWIHEAKELVQSCLGLKLMTRSKAWSTVADELWRYLLFSEFVFDLPEPLPEALAGVPRAPVEARPLVEDLCERLRQDRRVQVLYLQRAEAVERELELPGQCRAIRDLGKRDTFPFEERSFLAQALDALKADALDTARVIIDRHSQSIWIGKGESQAQWGLLRAALDLLVACADGERQLPDHAHSLDALLDFYLAAFREVDRLQREFEQAVNNYVDADGIMKAVVGQVRQHYGRVAAAAHGVLIRHVEKAGWPPPGRLANADVFDRVVAPKLKESGRKVALVLVDALRYELGVALSAQLGEDGKVELSAAFAQLPTITPVGMASLLPGAGRALSLRREKDGAVPLLDTQALPAVTQRLDVLRRLYGERFAEMTLSDFVKDSGRVPAAVELLVLRSAEIDAQLENHPESALGLIHDTFKRIRVAVHRLKTLHFDAVVIATDHGFLLNTHAGPGDVAAKPPGTWLQLHDRALLGAGTADTANCVLAAGHVGIRGDFAQFATPRGLVPYRAGQLYLHGGLSLQEAVVPVLSLQLAAAPPQDLRQATVELTYRQGTKKITTRLPVVDIRVTHEDLFAAGSDFEILIEAHDRKGNVVGEAKPGGPVNPATGTVTLQPGGHLQVALRMNLEFEGKFSVKALNPTTSATYAKLDLETDYSV